MIRTANKAPFLKSVAFRGLATQANPKRAASESEIQTTTLPNKLVIATTDSSLPVSRVSLVFRAGSRNETHENLGATHVIRAAAGVSSKRSTGFNLQNNVQFNGSEIVVRSDREVLSYTLQSAKDQLDVGLKFLQDASVYQIFKKWELEGVPEKLKIDWERLSQQQRAVDLLHKAAFRDGLGNSEMCALNKAKSHSPECLQQYVQNNLTTSRGAIVGVGVDHEMLVAFAKNLFLETGSDSTVASKYQSGDVRVDETGKWAHVAVGTQGAAITNQKEALAFAVLRNIAGAGSSSRHNEANGAVAKVVSECVGSSQYQFNSVNASYSDNGLFGFVLSADGRQIGKAVEAAVKALKSGSVSSSDLAAGKEKLKAESLAKLECNQGAVSALGTQAVLTGAVQTPAELAAAIDSLTSSDINAAAKKVASGKWSVGAVGNLSNVPYSDQL